MIYVICKSKLGQNKAFWWKLLHIEIDLHTFKKKIYVFIYENESLN